ncbi:MAG TPA: gephyrin-like molybdotransferase Glp [Candidatus Angelobacter sp.]
MSILSFEQAYETALGYSRALAAPQTEKVALLAANGRVLAEPLLADRDFPPFPRATRDGYALRAADLASLPATLEIIGEIKAGAGFNKRVKSGHAVEIMTGAAVPAGADAVVMVEYTSQAGSRVKVERAVAAGENVVAAGAEAHAGQELISPGQFMRTPHIAMAAAVGKPTLRVYRKPLVAILATGDELVDVSETPGPHQIRNSNTYSLAAQVADHGGEPLPLPVAPDEERKLTTLIHAGLQQADMLLLSGGVSMGKFDLVEQALSKLGAHFFFTGAQIQPGRPVVFGEVPNPRMDRNAGHKSDTAPAKMPFFGLPGNPVSVMVTFDLFVRPVLQALCGAAPTRLPAVQARLAAGFKTKTGLTRFLPALLKGGLYDPEVEVVPWQGSGDVLASVRANCYLVVPPDRERIAAGEMVSVLVR